MEDKRISEYDNLAAADIEDTDLLEVGRPSIKNFKLTWANLRLAVINFLSDILLGKGDVFGPEGATADNIAVFDGTTGKLIKDGGKGLPSGAVVGDTDIQTISNKRINPRQNIQTSPVSITPDKASYDEYYITALSENITINNATSPSVGNTFVIYLTDDGTSARTISFGNHYAGIGSALPTTTTKGKTMEIIIKYVTDSIALVSYSEKV